MVPILWKPFLHAQSLLETALEGQSKLVYMKPVYPRADTNYWSVQRGLKRLNELKQKNNNVLTDSLILVGLLQKAKVRNIQSWEKDEISGHYLVAKGKSLKSNIIIEELGLTDKEEIKKLKRQVRRLKLEFAGWRNYPVAVSRPVFSDDRQYAYISLVFGNSAGRSEIYKLVNGTWIFAGTYIAWAY